MVAARGQARLPGRRLRVSCWLPKQDAGGSPSRAPVVPATLHELGRKPPSPSVPPPPPTAVKRAAPEALRVIELRDDQTTQLAGALKTMTSPYGDWARFGRQALAAVVRVNRQITALWPSAGTIPWHHTFAQHMRSSVYNRFASCAYCRLLGSAFVTRRCCVCLVRLLRC